MIKQKANLPTTIQFILDRSGSMSTIQDKVISGFNEYIHGLKKSEDNIVFSLTTFDTEGIDHPYNAVKVKQVQPLSRKTYQPRSGTPLYDAAVNTIEAFAEKVKKDQPALVVIMTDGEENSSTEHDETCLKDLIQKLKARENWTFVFMGANQDAWANAARFGIDMGNTMNWESTQKGTQNAFAMLASSSVGYSNSMAQNKMLRSVGQDASLNAVDFFGGGK